MQSFLSANLNPVAWTPTNLARTLLNVTDHNLDISAVLFDVSNSGSGGRTARIAGKSDSAGTIMADYDIDQPPFGSPVPQIQEGFAGITEFFLTPTQAIQVPSIIEKVHYQSGGQNTQVKYSFDVKENVLAGAFVFPAL